MEIPQMPYIATNVASDYGDSSIDHCTNLYLSYRILDRKVLEREDSRILVAARDGQLQVTEVELAASC